MIPVLDSDRVAAMADLAEQMAALMRAEEAAQEIRQRIVKLKREVFPPGTEITVMDPDGVGFEPGVVFESKTESFDYITVTPSLRKGESWVFNIKEVRLGFLVKQKEEQP